MKKPAVNPYLRPGNLCRTGSRMYLKAGSMYMAPMTVHMEPPIVRRTT